MSYIQYMFDIPNHINKELKPVSRLKFMKASIISKDFYDTDLSALNNFTVISNVHTDCDLGVYVVRDDYVDIFMNTDDYDIMFTVEDYNKCKGRGSNILTDDRMTVADLKYPFILSNGLKTIWTVTTFKNIPIALTSKKDSNVLVDNIWSEFHRIKNNENHRPHIIKELEFETEQEVKRYSSFKVSSLSEGLSYLINFQK